MKVTNKSLNEPSVQNRSKALEEECVGKYLIQNMYSSNFRVYLKVSGKPEDETCSEVLGSRIV